MEGLAAGIGVQIVNMFFSSSSSSSSSSEDDEYNNPVFKACSCRKIPRITNYIERVVNNYNEKEFMQNFRYELHWLCEMKLYYFIFFITELVVQKLIILLI